MWPVAVEGKDRSFEKSHDLLCGQWLWKERTYRCFEKSHDLPSSGCGKNRLTKVLRNYIITYHVASGCGKRRLTDILTNHMTYPSSGCGKKGLTEVLINYIITYHVASGCGREGPKFG
jgi:hypothetical protein